MKIAVVSWLSGKPVPPTGYGGIERMVGIMSREFIRQGHEVALIAPEGSHIKGAQHFYTTDFKAALQYINMSDCDFVWDNTCWSTLSPVRQRINKPFCSTTHVNHAVGWNKNVVYLSQSQRYEHSVQLGKHWATLDNPIILVPADPSFQPKGLERKEYLLFIGSVTPWKGVLYAADLAQDLNRELWVAGPAWGEYAEAVEKRSNVKMLGEVTGDYKETLLEQAYAVMCLHNDGGIDWKEPGCGVVMEANAFDTPVFASNNGCLPELVISGTNGWCGKIPELLQKHKEYPIERGSSKSFADHHFSVERIAQQYLYVFNEIMNGKTYGN